MYVYWSVPAGSSVRYWPLPGLCICLLPEICYSFHTYFTIPSRIRPSWRGPCFKKRSILQVSTEGPTSPLNSTQNFQLVLNPYSLVSPLFHSVWLCTRLLYSIQDLHLYIHRMSCFFTKLNRSRASVFPSSLRLTFVPPFRLHYVTLAQYTPLKTYNSKRKKSSTSSWHLSETHPFTRQVSLEILLQTRHYPFCLPFFLSVLDFILRSHLSVLANWPLRRPLSRESKKVAVLPKSGVDGLKETLRFLVDNVFTNLGPESVVGDIGKRESLLRLNETFIYVYVRLLFR